MEIQLQSILLPDDEICSEEELYFHKKGSEIRLNGYFNLFYIEKRKAYTCIDDLMLRLSLKGYSKITFMHDETPIGSMALESDKAYEYTFDLPYDKYDKGVFWFSLTEDKDVSEREISGFYISKVEEANVRTVNIGIDICTYKNEDKVIRNLKLLKTRVLDNKELDASSHLFVYVIDNGKLKNTGGAGGFTRGMLEILNDREKRSLTHALLTDDDVKYEPDAFVRTYGLLATLKDEWKDMTVGGAMLREDVPHMLLCAGEYWKSGYSYNPLANTNLRYYENAAGSLLLETGHEKEWYSGWWYCCYSLNTVREDNLPLPIFLHQDDIEYGIRNSDKGIVFLNGICVWHRSSDLTFIDDNRYYDVRNNLIEIALHEDKGKQMRTASFLLFKAITLEAILMRYKVAPLVYQGLSDFLKGPEWLIDQDPEELNDRIKEMSDKMLPIEEVLATLSEEDRESAERQIEEYRKSIEKTEHAECLENKERKECKGESGRGLSDQKTQRKNRRFSPLKSLTFNGWIFPSDKKEIKLVVSTDSPYEGYRKQRLLLYEPGTDKGMVTVKSWRKMAGVIWVYIKTMTRFLGGFKGACEDWEKNVGKITNKEAWERYLGD